MQIEIYADILFLINFVMVYFIFFIVNKLIKNKVSLKRIAFNAFFTTLLYIITILFVPYYKVLSIFIIFSILIFSIFICFKPKNIKDFFKLFLLVNLVSFCIGGASIALFSYMNIDKILGNMLSFTMDNFSLKILLISISSTYIILKLSINWYKRVFIKKQIFYNIKLHLNGEEILLNALLDTGNNLQEPISKKPVIIAEFLAIKNILPDSLKVIFYEKQENNLEKLLESGYQTNIRFIPFKSMGKENGLLIGIKIDKLEIFAEEQIIIKDAIVAISNLSLSNDGFYKALLNPEMLEK